ncbi:hypothetical protein [Sphaerochaeta pleomorpha]|nr:hypothetical protein [Sphaerochaeta pleomorpha]
MSQNTWGQDKIAKHSVPIEFKQNLTVMGINIYWLVTGNGPMYLSEESIKQETGKNRIVYDRSELFNIRINAGTLSS